MSVEHLALVLHHSRAKGTDKLVLIGIANHAGDGGAWPSKATLARYANVNPQAVKRSLTRLVETGEVERITQAGWPTDQSMSDWHRPNLYRVLVECPEGCDRSPNHRPMPGWERLADGTYQPVDNSEDRGPQKDPGSLEGPRGGASQGPLTITTTGANSVSASTPDRAQGAAAVDNGPCQVCNRSRWACERAQQKLDDADRHTYTPRRQA